MSLRLRLLIVLILLSGIGLLVADIVTYVELRSTLVSRVDQQLDGISIPAANQLLRHKAEGTAQHNLLYAVTRDEAFIQVRYPGQSKLDRQFLYTGKGNEYYPKLPASLESPPVAADTIIFRHFSVPSQEKNGPEWRVAVSTSPGGEMRIVATTLRDVDATLNRLRDIEVALTSIILLSAVAIGVWLVGLGLRPLRNIERTAKAISGGDLTRRVTTTSSRTEVGRLGSTFNTMVGEIESAFAARAATEDRLRQFVADASHELRTPLTSIRGYAELFRRIGARDPVVASRAVARIEQEADRMSALVNDLLLLARMDEGQVLTLEPVDVALLVADSVEAARATEPDRVIAVNRGSESVPVLGDAHRLRQVVDNLLANVRAHTPPETSATVTLTCDAGRFPPSGRPTVKIEVADNGPGLEPERARRLFERFYRADPSRARIHGGSGLGLAIVASIVEAHHGRYGVETAPGRGTRVWIELPAMGGPPPVAAKFPPAESWGRGDASTTEAPSTKAAANGAAATETAATEAIVHSS